MADAAFSAFNHSWPLQSETGSQMGTVGYYQRHVGSEAGGALPVPWPPQHDAVSMYGPPLEECRGNTISTDFKRWPQNVMDAEPPGRRGSSFGTSDTGRSAQNPKVPWADEGQLHKTSHAPVAPWRVGSERRARQSWHIIGPPGPADLPATSALRTKNGVFNRSRGQISDFFPGDRGPTMRGRAVAMRPGSAPVRGRRASLQQRHREQAREAERDDWVVENLVSGMTPSPF